MRATAEEKASPEEFPYELVLAYHRKRLGDPGEEARVAELVGRDARWKAHAQSVRCLGLERATARAHAKALKAFRESDATPFCRAVARNGESFLAPLLAPTGKAGPWSRAEWDKHLDACPYCRRQFHRARAGRQRAAAGLPDGEKLLREWLLDHEYLAALNAVTQMLRQADPADGGAPAAPPRPRRSGAPPARAAGGRVEVPFFTADPQRTEAAGAGRDLRIAEAGGPAPIDREGECRAIKQRLKDARHPEALGLAWHGAVRAEDIVSELRKKPRAVHFSGHGGGAEGLYILGPGGAAELLSAATLKGFFRAARHRARLVVLNACHTADMARDLTDVADFAIGWRGRVEDAAACDFAKELYCALADRCTIGAAFDVAGGFVTHRAKGAENLPVLEQGKGKNATRARLVAPSRAVAPAPAPSAPRPEPAARLASVAAKLDPALVQRLLAAVLTQEELEELAFRLFRRSAEAAFGRGLSQVQLSIRIAERAALDPSKLGEALAFAHEKNPRAVEAAVFGT